MATHNGTRWQHTSGKNSPVVHFGGIAASLGVECHLHLVFLQTKKLPRSMASFPSFQAAPRNKAIFSGRLKYFWIVCFGSHGQTNSSHMLHLGDVNGSTPLLLIRVKNLGKLMRRVGRCADRARVQPRVPRAHLEATRGKKADRRQRLPSRPPLTTAPAADHCALRRRLDSCAGIEADGAGSYACPLGIDGQRYLTTAASASSPRSNRRRHCHFSAIAPTTKLPKWMKKSANDHEAGSSSGRRRRQDSPPWRNPARPRPIPPPRSRTCSPVRRRQLRQRNLLLRTNPSATGDMCQSWRRSGGGRMATPAATATFPSRTGGT
jgi:hypothetical protein